MRDKSCAVTEVFNWVSFAKPRKARKLAISSLRETWEACTHTVDAHTQRRTHMRPQVYVSVEMLGATRVCSYLYVRRASNIHSAGSTKWSLGFKHARGTRVPSIYRSFRRLFCTRSGFTRIPDWALGQSRSTDLRWVVSIGFLRYPVAYVRTLLVSYVSAAFISVFWIFRNIAFYLTTY